MGPEMMIAGSRALLVEIFLGCESLQAGLLHGRWVSTRSWFSSGLHWFIMQYIGWILIQRVLRTLQNTLLAFGYRFFIFRSALFDCFLENVTAISIVLWRKPVTSLGTETFEENIP